MNKLDWLKPYPSSGHYRWLESLKVLANYGEQRYYREGIRWSYFRMEGFAYHFVYLAGDDKFKPIREKCWPLAKGNTMPFNKLDRLPLFHSCSKVNDNALEGYYSRLHYIRFNRARYFWCGMWWIGLNIDNKLLSFTKINYMWKCRLFDLDAVNNGRCTGYFQWRLEVTAVKFKPIQLSVTASKVPDALAKESGVNLMPSKNEAATEVDRLKPSMDRPEAETSTFAGRITLNTQDTLSWRHYWWLKLRVTYAKLDGYTEKAEVVKMDWPTALEDWIDYWDKRVAEAKAEVKALEEAYKKGNVKADPVEFMQQDPIGVDRPTVTDYLSQLEQAHRGIFKKWRNADGVEVDPVEFKPDVEADPNVNVDRPFAQEYPMDRPEADGGQVDRPETTPMDRPSLTLEVPPHVALSWDDYFSNDPLSLIGKADPRLIVRDEAGTVTGYVKVKADPLNLKADPSEVATLKLIQPGLIKRGVIFNPLDKPRLTPYVREEMDRRMISEWSNPLDSNFKSIRKPKPGELIWTGADMTEEAKVKADPTIDAEDISRLERDIANSKPGGIIWVSSAEMIKMWGGNVQIRNREVYADPYEAQEKAG